MRFTQACWWCSSRLLFATSQSRSVQPWDKAAGSVLTHGSLDKKIVDITTPSTRPCTCIRGVIMKNWLLNGVTVKQPYYKKVPLHLDDASVHTALSGFLAKKCIIVRDHPLYPPNLAPCGFYFPLKSSSALKRTCFKSVPKVEKTTEQLNLWCNSDTFITC